MGSFWDSLKHTAGSIGGAAVAPAGLAYDLASMPFDNKDDDFGTVMHAFGKRGGDVVDPLFNPTTLTGGAISKAMNGMNWALVNGVSEPISTAVLMAQHADSTHSGILGELAGAKDFFDPGAWSHAYQLAQHQNAGQSIVAAVTNVGDQDPFAVGLKRGPDGEILSPYDTVTARKYPHGAGIASTALNVVGAWYLDPFVIGGKAVGAARMGYKGTGGLGKLSETEKGSLHSLLTDQSGRAGSRTDKWIDWVGGSNKMGRPLTGPEILAGTPELARYATEPHVIAGLVADANKLTDVTDRRNAVRRILAVAAGDTSQIDRLRNEMDESGALVDTLRNMVDDKTVDLEKLASVPTLRTDPIFVASLESQLKNINSRGDIDKFVDNFNTQLDQLMGTHDSLPNLPGVHPVASRTALDRANDTGLLRETRAKHRELDAWQVQQSQKMMSAQGVFQKGKYGVPLVVVKTAGLVASPYTKFLPNAVDAVRQVQYTGVAHLHDWGASTTQLDSMMRMSHVPAGERMSTLSKAYLAQTEGEKMLAINTVEELSMKSAARHYAEKYGRPEIDSDYLGALMLEGAKKRGASLAHIRGRAYATTEMPPAMNEQMAARAGENVSSDVAPKWRVDQIDDHGTPLALPLIETQLANSVPLLDMHLAKTMLKRDNGYLARLSRAWKQDSMEFSRLSGLKAAGHQNLDKAIAARAASADWAIAAGQAAMRVWKFGVLFRLGYPLRVLGDDHSRIWAKIGAGSFYGPNGREWIADMYWNRTARRSLGKEQFHALQARRQVIKDQLEGEQMVNHSARSADLAKLNRQIAAHRRSLTKLQAQAEESAAKRSLGLDAEHPSAFKQRIHDTQTKLTDAEAGRDFLIEQLGDTSPEALKEELARTEEMLLGGWKQFSPEKRRLGSVDVRLDNGVSIPGAYAGDAGAAWRSGTSTNSFQQQVDGVEEQTRAWMSSGSFRTINSGEPGHLEAMADVFNNQFRNSPVAMHFVRGGDIEDFVRWVSKPEQAELRKRLPHFAHDPEDWGGRVQAMVRNYIPNDAVREAVEKGRVTPRQLKRLTAREPSLAAVHGRSVADNLGTSGAALGAGKVMHRLMKFLGEMPTDTLSRHPYFNSMYKMHARDIYAVRKAALKPGEKLGQKDLDEIVLAARKHAFADLKRTLFDVSAHSHAAHVLRFVSPFFAAHQEGVMRWWRIAADNPSAVRRFTQAFDLPKSLGLVVDENGDPVKPGTPLSRNDYVLLQVPPAWGGPDPRDRKNLHTGWRLRETSFNLALQGGLSNPGLGPFVQVPADYFAQKYANDPTIAKITRVFNPYPPNSPLESVFPAVFKRMASFSEGEFGFDPSFGTGVGAREYNESVSRHVQDLVVDFKLKYDREPNRTEMNHIIDRAGHEATTESFHRILWNSLSPAPATPGSKYAAIQQGWYKISTQARAEGKDFDWSYQQFRAKYGDAYMPLIYSSSNNPAWVDANPATVGAIKHYRGILKGIDPALTRMVVGPYADEMIQKNASLGEYSPQARNFLKSTPMQSGSSDPYFSDDDPRTAAMEQQARRGWQKYGELTGSLTAIAQAKGLNSYEDDPQLVALKRAGVAQIQSENPAFAQDYGTFDSTKYDRYLVDMKRIASSPTLANDPERTDIKTLQDYLKLRDTFSAILKAREAAGIGGPDASANDSLRAGYTALVGRLVESNTYFETYFYNGIIERDPLLLKEN